MVWTIAGEVRCPDCDGKRQKLFQNGMGQVVSSPCHTCNQKGFLFRVSYGEPVREEKRNKR